MKNFQYLPLSIFTLILFSCGSETQPIEKEMEEMMEEEVFSAPELTTKPISDLTPTSVKTGGIITALGNPLTQEVGVVYDTEPNPQLGSEIVEMAYQDNDFDVMVEGLDVNTTYYLKAYARSANDLSYGNEVSFSTPNYASVEPTCETETNTVQINGKREFSFVYDSGNPDNGPFSFTANGNQGDMTFHFGEKPVTGYYITSSNTDLQKLQCSITGVFSNFFWRAHSGDTLFVNRPTETSTSMTFCNLTFSTSEINFDIENTYGNVTHEE